MGFEMLVSKDMGIAKNLGREAKERISVLGFSLSGKQHRNNQSKPVRDKRVSDQHNQRFTWAGKPKRESTTRVPLGSPYSGVAVEF